MKAPVLQVQNLTKHFPITGGLFSRVTDQVRAVDNVSFDLYQGETLGLVGESGCGKSTTGRVILRLLEATSGEVIFEEKNIFDLKREEMRMLRQKLQIIFQDPYASLNPRMTVGQTIGEAMEIHSIATGVSKKNRTKELLEVVGLNPDYYDRYAHEFSGGQRQRIGIARALAVNPSVIVCDEPVSALDVSIQSQVINLLEDLQKEYGLTYLFIAHDLSVVKHISDRIAVMYLGKIVEIGAGSDLYSNPLHPYTKALLSAVPIPDPDAMIDRIVLEGDVPSPINPPEGCRFHTRCPFAEEICSQEEPVFKEHREGHQAACHIL